MGRCTQSAGIVQGEGSLGDAGREPAPRLGATGPGAPGTASAILHAIEHKTLAGKPPVAPKRLWHPSEATVYSLATGRLYSTASQLQVTDKGDR